MTAKLRVMLAGFAAIAIAAPATAQQQQRPVPTNVQLTFHIIEADGFDSDDAEIRPIVTELRKLFRFRGYRLLSRSVLASTSWPPSKVQQQIALDGDDRVFWIRADIEGSQTTDIRISVTLDGRFPEARHDIDNRLISASVNLQNGKTVVLGSSRQDGKSAAIILAVTPVINP